MSKEKAKICLESALSEFRLYESLGIRDYLKSAYDNMIKALKELEDWVWLYSFIIKIIREISY